MNLAVVLEEAERKNQEKLTARISCPALELTPEARNRFSYFAHWCRDRGVRALPAMPATIAVFIKNEHQAGISGENIWKSVQAIELAHSQDVNLANPVATAVVRQALAEVYAVKAPRSWSSAEHLIFYSLPIELRDVVKRHADLTSLELRRLHNKVADLSKKENLKCLPVNQSTVVSTDSKPTTPSS
jgi:hypothetical protein